MNCFDKVSSRIIFYNKNIINKIEMGTSTFVFAVVL